MKSRTQDTRTPQAQDHSAVSVAGKDPKFDYSFRRRKDIEDGGGMDILGFEPVGEGNSSDERWNGPKSLQARTKGRKQIVNQDTILCRRPLETARYFKRLEDEKYNAQCRLVLSAAKNSQQKLRSLDPGAVVVDRHQGLEAAMVQRTGPTTEADNG